MTQEEMDKLIADAVADSKKQSKWHRSDKGKASRESIMQARKVLNFIFMIGVIATFAIYFLMPESKVLFFSIGFGSVIIKIVEFVLRFMF